MISTEQPLVSVIVPVYNSEAYLDDCVRSIINQTYKNIEIILVDDGASDSCPKKCDDWSTQDPRIKVVHKTNGGLSDARNAGLDSATGEFISFVDSDDVIDPRMIKELLSLQKRYNSEIVSCESRRFINGVEQAMPRYHKEQKLLLINNEEFLRGLVCITMDSSVCNKLFSKEIIANKRFRVGKFNEDILFLFELIPSISIVVHTNKGYYKYRVTEGSLTNTFSARNLDFMYNSFELYEQITVHFPEIAAEAKKRCVLACQSIIFKILDKSLQTNSPFDVAFKKSRCFLIDSIPFVLCSSLFSIKEKVRVVKYVKFLFF